MDALKEFVCYPFVVLKWTASTWWSIVKAHLGWSAIATLIAFVISVALHLWLINRWPVLKELLGDPMAAIGQYLVYGILGVVGVHIAALLVLLVAAPSQVYREQKRKIASLMPPPLNLTLTVGHVNVTADRMDLDNLTLINHSSKSMELTFCIRTQNGREVPGAWHPSKGRSTQAGQPTATVDKEATVSGALVFQSQDGPQGVFSDGDCTLKICDAVSRAVVLCQPKVGYPGR